MDVSEANPFKSWLSDPAWNDILALCDLPAFKDFKQNFKTNAIKWEEAMSVNSPMESISALLGDGMDGFKKLCVLRCIRPDAVVRERNIPHSLLYFIFFCTILHCTVLHCSVLFPSRESILKLSFFYLQPLYYWMLHVVSSTFLDIPVFFPLHFTSTFLTNLHFLPLHLYSQ